MESADGPHLEEVAAAVMAKVEGEGVAREEAPDEAREAGRATPEQQVGMVGEQESGWTPEETPCRMKPRRNVGQTPGGEPSSSRRACP